MISKSCSRAIGLASLLFLGHAFFSPNALQAQTVTYHVHNEASSTAGLLQLKTANPDVATVTLASANLNGVAIGEYLVKAFDTQTGVPNASGVIPAGSSVSFTLWMRKSASTKAGTMFPRAKIYLNSDSGALLCVATGTTALTTTATKVSLTCNTAANISMTTADRFYLWVGTNVTAKPTVSVTAQLNIEGALNGNYDSLISVPLPTPPPSISGLSPTSGASGTAVTISGANFRATQGSSTVTFNGVIATPSSWSETSIVAPVPGGATTGPVVVTVGGQASNGVTFTVPPPPPQINSLSPTFGPIGAGVTIAGLNFGATQGSSTVTFNGMAATPSSWSGTSIIVPVPSGVTTGPVVVTVEGQASNRVTFTVGDIHHLHAEASVTERVLQLNMDGPDAAATSVAAVMTGKTGEQLIRAFDTSLSAGTIPAGATFSATLWMRKDTSNGTMTPRAKLYLNDPTGTLLCTATTTTTLAVSTSTPTKYVLTCTTTSSVTIASTDRLYLWVGVNITTGSGNKAVSAYAHLEGALNGNYDSYVVGPLPSGAGPKITALSPLSGPAGTSVTISGAGFGGAQGTSSVAFNGITATPSAWSDASITVPVPMDAATGPVTVTVSGVTSNKVTFTVVNPPSNISSIPGEGYIYLRWGAPVNSDPLTTTYNVYRRTPTSSYTVLSTGVTAKTYQDSTAQPGVIYRYVVTAVYPSGHESVYSTETRELQTTPTILKSYNVANELVSAPGDLNGDGLIDFAFGYLNAQNNARVDVFLGGSTSSRPNYTLNVAGYGTDPFGLAMVDLNRDGFADLLVGEPGYSMSVGPDTYSVGRVSVYAGGAQFSTSPVFTMTGPPQQEGCFANGAAGKLGYSIASAGDINGDSYLDAVASAPWVNNCSGKVIFIMGGPNLATPATSEWGGPLQFGFAGFAVSAAGDANGDGFGDVLVGAPARSGFQGVSVGKGYLLTGGSSMQLAATFETGIVNDWFGYAVSSAGDFNGDGFSDVAVLSRSGGHVYFGGASVDSTQDMFVQENAYFNGTDAISGANNVFPAGRLNGDAFDDAVIDYGITAYFGGSDRENYADVRNGGPLGERRVLGVVDFNGDGVNEVITTDSVSPPTAVRIESLSPYLSLPEIKILSPSNYVTTFNQTITLQGTVSGPVLNLTVRGSPVAVTDGTFQTDLVLAEGGNIIEIIAETPDGRLVKRTLDITFTVPPPLIVEITNPADGVVLNSTPISVTGTVSAPSAGVIVQGVNATVTGNTFTATGIALVEGANSITATATDGYGQTSTDSITVTLLTKGTVTGTVTDSATSLALPGVNVTIQEASGTVTAVTDANGVYLATVTQGSITVTFSKAGYISQTATGTVTAGQTLTTDKALTPTPPLTITISSPQDGAELSSTPVTVTGSVSNSAQVSVNGSAATVTGSTYSVSIPLSSGANTITATATDGYGQTATATIIVTLLPKGTLAGTVTNASTAQPLQSASILVTDVVGITQTAQTDANGQYTLSNVAEGTVTGSIAKAGYVTYALSGVITAGQTLTVNAALSPLNLTITSPLDGAVIERSEILVQGTFSATAGQDMGVRVNGVIGSAVDGEFTANHMPLTDGANTLTVTLTDIFGNTSTASVTVQSVPAADEITLNTNIQSGIAPLQATLTIDSTFPLTASTLSASGPGPVELTAISPSQVQVAFSTVGMYLITASVTDAQSVVHTDTLAFAICSPSQMEAVLQGKWSGMRAKLMNGDIEGTMTYFVGRAQEKYRPILQSLQASLPDIFSGISTLHLLSVADDEAEMEAIVNGDSYPVIFMRDETGIWKLLGF